MKTHPTPESPEEIETPTRRGALARGVRADDLRMNAGGALAAVVIAAAAIAGGIVGVQQNAEMHAAAALAPVVSTPPAQLDPYALLEAHAPGATLTWSDDPSLNCGGYRGGCFWPQYPDTIIISYGAKAKADILEYVVLHEAAHVLQHRQSLPLDECAADTKAIVWGADPALAHYLPTCSTPTPETKEG